MNGKQSPTFSIPQQPTRGASLGPTIFPRPWTLLGSAVALLLSIQAPLHALPPRPGSERPPGSCSTDLRLAVTLERLGQPRVGSSVRFRATEPKLVGLSPDCSPAERYDVPSYAWELVSKPTGSYAALSPGNPGLTSPPFPLDRPGQYRIRFIACPSGCTFRTGGATTVAGRQSSDAVLNVGLADLWIMGIEVNQAIQDRVYIDLARSPGVAGNVVVDKNATPPAPIIPGKPLVVRVYVGLRVGRWDATDDVSATGSLFVRIGRTTVEHQLRPIQNGGDANCRAADGGNPAQQDCRAVTAVSPVDSSTPGASRVSLIARRTHWEGTLNFVVPADMTQQLASPGSALLRLRATVEPVGPLELQPGDNTFTLELRNIAQPDPLRMRLVRIGFRSADGTTYPAPTRAAADQALAQMLRFLPYNHLDTVSDTAVVYDGSVVSLGPDIDLGFTDIDLSYELNQCDSLWALLAGWYGPDPSNLLFGLLSAEAPALTGNCDGIGFRLPTEIPFIGGAGVAFAKMPSDLAQPSQADQLRRLTTMAQELYHAELDRRHVSDDHGEDGGCPIHGAGSTLVNILTLGAIDADCHKPPTYPHGAIGEYPEGWVVCDENNPVFQQQPYGPELLRLLERSDCRGTPYAKRVPGSIAGERGAMGVDVWRDARGVWQLRLLDPCPTDDIQARWDDAEHNYRCVVEDYRIPHDFMSYGPDMPPAGGVRAPRWTTRQQFFAGPGLKPFEVEVREVR